MELEVIVQPTGSINRTTHIYRGESIGRKKIYICFLEVQLVVG